VRLIKCPHCNGEGVTPFDGVGKVFAGVRASKGLTLRAVEANTGISNAYLSQIETGKIKDPSFDTVRTLCQFYGLDMKDL